MADILKDGLDFLADELKEHASRSVTYKRGTKQVTVKAVLGRSTFTLDELDGVRREFTDRDYLIHAADLILGGVEVTPEIGDVIVDTNEGPSGGNVYEVLAAFSESSWRWSGPYHKLLRIHVKQVE